MLMLTRLLVICIDSLDIKARDFNYVDIRTVPSKFLQHMNCNLRGANILDKVYPNNKLGCRARPLPHLGQSDQMSLLLIMMHPPQESALPTTRIVKTWPDDASKQLQDCYNRTCWDIFEQQDLEVIIDTVLCYIRTCTNIVTVDKHIQLLKERNTAFRSSDRALYSMAHSNLKKGIRKPKADYTRRIRNHLDSNTKRLVWQAVQHHTNYRPSLGAAKGDPSLAEDLKLFFDHFLI